MMMNTQSRPSFDDLLKGAVFILGALFLAFCVLHALFGPWWSLVIARVGVVLGLLALLALAGFGLVQKIRINKHLAQARIRKAYANSTFAVIQDHKGTQQIVYDARNNAWRQFFKPGNAKLFDRMTAANSGGGTVPDSGPAKPSRIATGPEPEPLLPVLQTLDRILIIGGQGAGKTSLLNWLVEQKLADAHVMILDSHASPFDWPEYAQVVGLGRDYAAIDAAFDAYIAELDRRYKLRATGEQLDFDKRIMVADELFAMNANVDVKNRLKTLLTEARKVNMGVILAGHSERAANIGLDGSKDLLNGYQAQVFLDVDDEGRHVAEVKTGKRSRRYLHPGPYTVHGTRYAAKKDPVRHVPPEKPCTVYHIPMSKTGATESDAEIIDLYQNGESLNGICRQVVGSTGGKQSKKVKRILATHGLI